MSKALIGLALAAAFGALCRLLDVPAPSPNTVLGVALVVALAAGYMVADALCK